MKLVVVFISFLAIATTLNTFGQKQTVDRAFFVQTEYQFLAYNYFSVGLGYQPKKSWLKWTRRNSKFGF
jgi:hypothetical protein